MAPPMGAIIMDAIGEPGAKTEGNPAFWGLGLKPGLCPTPPSTRSHPRITDISMQIRAKTSRLTKFPFRGRPAKNPAG